MLYADEVWKYDTEPYLVGPVMIALPIARLVAIRPICHLCSDTKHVGHTRHERGFIPEEVYEHYQSINACDRQTTELAIDSALSRVTEQSRQMWKLDWGIVAPLVSTRDYLFI
jgi:hypothetical protein